MMNDLLIRYPKLTRIEESIKEAVREIISSYEKGGKLLLCGNGGSAADCDHIVGELMKSFLKRRPVSDNMREEMKSNAPYLEDGIISRLQCGLPAISLTSMTSLCTATANDIDPDLIYAQALMALGNKKDILLAISTSGNSENICIAAKVAKALGMRVVALTGASGGRLKDIADVCVTVPEEETYKIQELHLPVYHFICAQTEDHFFG